MAACLHALRAAVSAGRTIETPAVFSPTTMLTLEGAQYPASAPTGFVSSVQRVTFDLATLVVFWEFGRSAFTAGRDINFSDYVKHCTERKCGFLLLMDIALVRDYLRGLSEAEGRVVVQEARGAAVRVGPLEDEESRWTAAKAMQQEVHFKTRRSVLECGRNIKDDVFRHFIAAPAADAPGAGASSSSSSSSSAAAAAAAAAGKRPTSAAEAAGGGGGGGGAKRARADPTAKREEIMAKYRGTPIILVPSSASSIITLFNAKQLLEGGTFVHSDVARAACNGQKPQKVEIHRTDAQGRDVKYYILDNPALLSREDWLLRRVLAVFAAGPEWQFKGWKWGAEKKGDVEPEDVLPVKIFSMGACWGGSGCASALAFPSLNSPPPPRATHTRPPQPVLGFHLHYEGDPPHENATQWAVKCIPVSKTQRFLDSGVARRFWSVVDEDVSVRRPHLGGKD
jgi:hypothetical protein